MKTKKAKNYSKYWNNKSYEYNNLSNITLNQTEVKQLVGKRKNKKRYLCPLLVESLDRVDGLYTLRSSHDGCCRCILNFFYTRLTIH